MKHKPDDPVIQAQMTAFAEQIRMATSSYLGIAIVLSKTPEDKGSEFGAATGIAIPDQKALFDAMNCLAMVANGILGRISGGKCELFFKTPSGPLPMHKATEYRQVMLGDDDP